MQMLFILDHRHSNHYQFTNIYMTDTFSATTNKNKKQPGQARLKPFFENQHHTRTS